MDHAIAGWMVRYGHFLHRISLGLFFLWVGVLKVLGYKTATSLIAHTVYVGSPDLVVPILGAWEAAIGLCLLSRRLVRAALLLLVIRLPGTLLALILKADVCFEHVPLVPTPEGQYLIKDVVLITAAIVIGATVRMERRRGHLL